MVDVIRHLKEKYGKIITQELFEYKDTTKKTSYHTRKPIATVFFAVEELLEFANITRIWYTQHQAFSIDFMIIHSTGKFTLSINEWNCIPTIQKTWVGFKLFLNGASQTKGDERSHRAGCGNAPHEHGE